MIRKERVALMGAYKKSDGFTMIEVIVTLVILAVLAAFAIPSYMGFVKDSQAKECAAYTAMLTRDCQQLQRDLTDSPTRRVIIDETQRNKIFYTAILDEFDVDLQSGAASDIKIIEKNGKKMVAGICQDGGNYYTQMDNGNINVYCDNHNGIIADINPDVVDGNNVTINYRATVGGSVSLKTETVAVSADSASGSTATANAGYTFVNWTRNGVEVGGDPTFKPEPNAGKFESATYTANFSEDEVTITYKADPGGTVNPGSESIKALTGTAVGSTATPEAGYKFSNWVDSSGNIVEDKNPTFYPQKVNGAYIPATYTAKFEELGNVITIGDVNSYFNNTYQNWQRAWVWDLNWDPATWSFTWFRARTQTGVVYSYANWLTDWGWMEEAGTYVSVGKLDQNFAGWFASTDNFYRWLSPEKQKKFIKITDTTPLYKADNVSGNDWATTSPPPSFGNLYEYNNLVYIWTNENTSITPPTNPTAEATNNYWVKIEKP